MSVVTNILLTFSSFEEEIDCVNSINNFEWFIQRSQKLISIDDSHLNKGWYGGSKYFEAILYVGAFNHFDIEGFVNYLNQSVQFKYPQHVLLLVQGPMDDHFTCILLDGR